MPQQCVRCDRTTCEPMLIDERYYCYTCGHERIRCSECGTALTRLYAHHIDGAALCSRCHENLTTWKAGRFTPVTTYEKLTSDRRFGVEFETSRCPNYRDIKEHTLFGAKYDCSVTGMEFVSPILYGDEGLAEVEFLCELAEKHGFEVDGDCGFHLHIDMSRSTGRQRRVIAYAYLLTYRAWTCFVNSYRAHDCTYCHAPRISPSEVRDSDEDFESLCEGSSRYGFINFAALDKHGTYEIRGYQGTLDFTVVSTWIKSHLAFADKVGEMTFAELDNLFGGSDEQTLHNLLAMLPVDAVGVFGINPTEEMLDTMRVDDRSYGAFRV